MYVFLSFSLSLIYVITLEKPTVPRRNSIRERHMCIMVHLLSPLDICLFAGAKTEKGYSGYKYDHVAFLGFRYYHSIEYTKLD